MTGKNLTGALEIQKQWNQWRNGYGNAGAQEQLVRRLRSLADHIENGKYPIVLGCEMDSLGESQLMYNFRVVLSHPWPG